MTPQAASQFTKIVGYVSIGFALAIAAGAYPPTSGAASILYDVVLPAGSASEAVTAQSRLLSAIAGGVFASWSVFLIMIVAPALRRGDEEIRRAAITAIFVWFVIDSTGSAAAGVPMNVFYNTLYLVTLLIPLMLVKRGVVQEAAA